MEFVTLADAGLRLSRVGLGTWAMGGGWWGPSDRQESYTTIRKAIDLGITTFDTAPIYGLGVSEEVLGQAIKDSGCRDRVVLATKAGLEWTNNKVVRNSSLPRLAQELEDSLRRLQTDVIDLYQIHWPDPLEPIEETAAFLGQLLQQGKIRAIGVSNFSPEQMDRFRQVAPLHTAQPPYNLFERQIEAEVLPYCREHGIHTLVYSPLCRGLLSGRMTPQTTFPSGDMRAGIDPKFVEPRYSQYLKAAEALSQFAQDRYGKTLAQLAVRWLLDQPGVSVALWGARKPHHLEAISGLWGWSLDAEAMQTIEDILQRYVPESIPPSFMSPPARAA
ncbi:aldo/keto reductase [Synechococcus sp. R55.3]|uniref:aldo/keto reductase n=2 Tax=unclassified Synechococcus TaxID=2626047 RepID=UPI0039C44926